MSDMEDRKPRLVVPRRWVIAGSVASVSALAAARGFAQSAEGGEGGEGGEGAMLEALEGDVEFLTELGLFEATHRIVAALYAEGHVAEAQEHLAQSHHADYEDLEDDLVEHGAASFADEAGAFAVAVQGGADAATVAADAEAVLAAIAAAYATEDAADEMKAAEALVRIAYEDFSGGVDAGEILAPQEYRDAWGFVDVARARLKRLAASQDAEVAKAGQGGLTALEPVAALFAGGLAAERAGEDASLIAGAAARIEIAGLRL